MGNPRRGERGWALVSVLWVVVILAMMAATVQSLTLVAAHMEQRATQRAQADAALNAAIARAALGISDSRINQRWRVDGEHETFSFNGLVIDVRVQDELGRIDLNAADGSMINRLLQSAGVSNESADTLTNRILDWRSTSGVQSQNVATDADYAAAGNNDHIRHGAFQSVLELQLVLGITPELYKKISPALTVYTGRPAFDPNFAPEEALRALYLNEPAKVAELISRRRQGGGSELGSHPGVLSAATTLAGRTFSVTAELHIGSSRYVRRAVVELTGDDERPYFFLAWQ